MHHGNGHGEAFAAAAALHDGPDGNPERRRQNPMHLFAGNTATAHQPPPRRKHPMQREAHRAMTRCRATPRPSRAEQRGARQSKKGSTQMQNRCTLMHADGPESGMLLHGRHRTTAPEKPR